MRSMGIAFVVGDCRLSSFLHGTELRDQESSACVVFWDSAMEWSSSRLTPSSRRLEERRDVSPQRSLSSVGAKADADAVLAATARDVKAVADAQSRLVRVIEDVSQELTQRLAVHDTRIQELQSALHEVSSSQQSLHDTFNRVQVEETAWHSSLNAEYLRLRTSDGEYATRLQYLESKVAAVEKFHHARTGRWEELELLPQKWQQLQLQEKEHTEALTRRVRLCEELQQHLPEQLSQQLSQQMSQQLSQQLNEILQQQLEQHVQPQLQSQLQRSLEAQDAQLRPLRELKPKMEQELQKSEQKLQQLEKKLLSGQEALRAEAGRREQHLAELQGAAQRLAQTAMQRAQERHKRRIARLEEDLATSPRLKEESQDSAARSQDSASERRPLTESEAPLLRSLDELRVQFFTELSDVRSSAQHVELRVARCESDIIQLRAQVTTDTGANSTVRRARPVQGTSPSSQGCPTPDWPVSPWEGPKSDGQSARPLSLPTLPSSPQASSSLAIEGSPAPANTVIPQGPVRYLKGMPEGPQLTSWDWDDKALGMRADSPRPSQDSPSGKAGQASARFGVLPPPKVTPASPH
ncbi:unnamed protein product [Effrenium voratum]|nr:unnamed protein product [Effrenium voratum]